MKKAHLVLTGLLALVISTAPGHLSADTTPSASTNSVSLSHVRIVRLSFVQGDVAVRRPSESDWSAGTVNTPIQEGFAVATPANGYAEVEFENGSTARLGQGSQVEFTELALTSQGDRINKLSLSKGYATFRFTPEHHDQYEVDASGVTIVSRGKAEFRANYTGDSLRVEVFDGQVTAEHDGKTQEVNKNRVLTYDPNAVEALNVSEGLQKDAWDKWTQARDQQSMLATNDEAVSLNKTLYGWDDLDTYGEWSLFPGYGYGWAPYEPAGWSPYAAGMWGNYPGWGMTWISAEPWGWLPFHNGFWNYDASMGWFWMPGPLDMWSPALVNWYSGPGWVGWAPIGTGGAACAIGLPGCLTAVAPSSLQPGTPYRPGSPLIVKPVGLTGATRIAAPQVGMTGAIRAAGPMPAVAKAGAAASLSEATIHGAPSSVVMGRDVTPDSFLGHHSFLSGAQPIHAQLGRTIGGIVPTVMGRNGELSPDANYHPAGVQGAAAMNRVPMVMEHGAAGQQAAAMDARGGITPASAASTPGMSRASAPSNSSNAATPSASSSANGAASAPASASAASAPSGAHR
jgi:FecR protein